MSIQLLVAHVFVGVLAMTEQRPSSEAGAPVWGNPLRGAAITMSTDKLEYRVGEPIRLRLRIRNHGTDDLRLLSTDVVTTYRVTVFHEDGRSVAKSDLLQRAEANSERAGALTRSVTVLRPGEETSESFELSQMARLEEPGSYVVVAIRRLMSWDEGFLVSNALRLRLVPSR